MKFKFWLSVLGGALAGGLLFLVLVALGFFVWMVSVLLRFLLVGAAVTLLIAIVVQAFGALSGGGNDKKPRDD